MGKLLDELRKFLSTATPEQIEQAWKEVEQFKDVGPTISEFVSAALTFDSLIGAIEEIKISNCKNPELYSGFFYKI